MSKFLIFVFGFIALLAVLVCINGFYENSLRRKGTETFYAEVDYSKPVSKVIQLSVPGFQDRDWIDKYVTDKNFPVRNRGKKRLEFVIYSPNREITSDEVLAYFKKENLRPADIQELLAFMKQYHDAGHQVPSVVVLGSALQQEDVDALGRKDAQWVPVAGEINGNFSLHLNRYSRIWRNFYSFLAVQEKN